MAQATPTISSRREVHLSPNARLLIADAVAREQRRRGDHQRTDQENSPFSPIASKATPSARGPRTPLGAHSCNGIPHFDACSLLTFSACFHCLHLLTLSACFHCLHLLTLSACFHCLHLLTLSACFHNHLQLCLFLLSSITRLVLTLFRASPATSICRFASQSAHLWFRSYSSHTPCRQSETSYSVDLRLGATARVDIRTQGASS